jgi:hypothetical protein
MTLSEFITLCQAVLAADGDGEVLDKDGYLVKAVTSATPTEYQVTNWYITPGEMFFQIKVDN